MSEMSKPATDPELEPENEPSEITYAEHLHPARPRALRFRPRVEGAVQRVAPSPATGRPTGENPAYVSWLLAQSMLADANEISQQFSGQGSMWQNPFANPNPAGRGRRRHRCGSPRTRFR